jgi:ATP-dependent Clp protease ATP-binding subunit ClpA
MKTKTIEKNVSSDLIISPDSSLLNSQKILIEKRRRYQTYMALDYFLSAVTYFDFFSLDTFNIVKNAKYLAQICNKNVTSELLLLPFFKYQSEVSVVLNEFGITETSIEDIVASLQEKRKETFFEKQQINSSKFINKIKGIFAPEILSLDQKIKYSHEVNQIFEKAAENALQRFKTPVITPEILFITIVEEKNNKASKILKKFIKTESEWYLFRYKLIKRIHNQESGIRGEIVKSQHFFAYLLKTQLSEIEFNKLIETESLPEGVSFFRNTLVSKVLETNIFEELSNEISISIKTNNKRSYSG